MTGLRVKGGRRVSQEKLLGMDMRGHLKVLMRGAIIREPEPESQACGENCCLPAEMRAVAGLRR